MFSGIIILLVVSGTSITYNIILILTGYIHQTATLSIINIMSNNAEIGKLVILLKAVGLLIVTVGIQLLYFI